MSHSRKKKRFTGLDSEAGFMDGVSFKPIRRQYFFK